MKKEKPNKWTSVYNLLALADSQVFRNQRSAAADTVRKAAAIATAYTRRAGTREETSMGLAILAVLSGEALEKIDRGKIFEQAAVGAALRTAQRIVAREAALAVVRNVQRRVIRERGRAKTEAAKAARDRSVDHALANVWATFKVKS